MKKQRRTKPAKIKKNQPRATGQKPTVSKKLSEKGIARGGLSRRIDKRRPKPPLQKSNRDSKTKTFATKSRTQLANKVLIDEKKIAKLQNQLQEAQETLNAIRNGQVDAV